MYETKKIFTLNQLAVGLLRKKHCHRHHLLYCAIL